MSDYLWDRSGALDPEIARLEVLLAPLRLSDNVDVRRFAGRLRQGRRLRRGLLLAGAVAALALVATRLASRPGWEVDRLEGAPRVGATLLDKKGRWHVGDWLETDATSRARVRIGRIGHVVVDPGTRVRLVAADAKEHRLGLERGVLHASVSAPPRLFLVETPAALAADLGCAYTMAVRPDGGGRLDVTAGAVSLEGRVAAYVPAGAWCALYPRLGPGVPLFADAPPGLRGAIRSFESGASLAWSAVLTEARARDTLTLWHLLPRVTEAARAQVLDRLEALAPGGPDRRRTLALDPAALASWRQRLQGLWWVGGLPAKVRREEGL